MRTIVDVEKEKLEALTVLAHKAHISRAALIRHAIDTLLQDSLKQKKTEDVFGILKERRKIEGVAYQKRIRAEWEV